MSNATAIRDPRVGTVVQDRYRLLQRVAAGGMGVVYRGERVGLGRQVAVKFLHPWIAEDASFKSRFALEAQVMGRLDHPCCVSIIDSGMDGETPFLVMDYVTGPTLRLVLQDGALAPARALRLVRQILAGLTHAHAQGIIHRDLKPENIVLTETAGLGEQVRLLDFGLARFRDAASGLTMGLVVGTPNYMPPEQVRAEAVDERTDLYALGVVLFELLTGKAPFAAPQSSEILHRQLHSTPPPLIQAVPDATFSDALQTVLTRALAKSPDARFQSASEFARALEETPEAREALLSQVTGATPPPSAHPGTAASQRGAAAQGASDGAAPSAQLGRTGPGLEPTTPSPRSPVPTVAFRDRGAGGGLAPPQNAAVAQEVLASGLPQDGALPQRGLAAGPGMASSPAADLHSGSEALAPTQMSRAPLPAPVGPRAEPVVARWRAALAPGGERLRNLAALAAFLLLAAIGLIGFTRDRGEVAPEPPAQPAAGTTAAGTTGTGSRTQPAQEDPSQGSRDRAQTRPPGQASDEGSELARIRQLAAGGHRDRALRAIAQLRGDHPGSAAAALLAGQINFDHLRWGDGLEAYRDALRLAPGLRSDPELIQDVIGCLVSDRAYRQCATFLQEEVGAPALAHLEEAAGTSRYANVQSRARALLQRGSFRAP